MSNRTLEMDDRLYHYLEEHSFREAEVLTRLRKETAQLGNIAAMQISPEQGQFMSLLIEMMGAQRLLEVGTFTGYSTLVCAMTLPPDGKIIACDVSDEWTRIGRGFWQEAGVEEKIELKIAPAVGTLNHLLENGQANTFDMMFIDADKPSYDTYYELGLKLIRPGGLILIDNTLWGGDVADPSVQDDNTKAIRALNDKLVQDNRVSMCLLPIGDGLTIARRRL